MEDPELRLLKYFAAVAEERHFGRAAERLHLAQPPLSQQIRKLEHQLGVELIDRSRRPIELTDAGDALYKEATLALAHGERAFAAARRAARGHLGHLRIGALQAAVDGVVPAVLREHRSAFPGVELELLELRTHEQVEQLSAHRLDVGFLRGPVDEAALSVEKLLDDPLAVAIPDHDRFSGQALIEPQQLAHEEVVLWARAAAPTTYADVVELFRRYSIQPQIVAEAPRIQTVLALVAAGIGLALLPTSFANLSRLGVRFVPLAGALPDRPIALAWRSSSGSPTLAAFLNVARAAVPRYLKELAMHYPELVAGKTTGLSAG
jgi:DNA-binding transcriptional LysR family regulator